VHDRSNWVAQSDNSVPGITGNQGLARTLVTAYSSYALDRTGA